MAIGNGKCNFKRKITENHFSAGKNNNIHKIYKISKTKWIYFHATLLRICVYINNTHLYVNGISNILYVQSLWENRISIFPPYWNGIEDFQKRKRQFFETENQYPYCCLSRAPNLVAYAPDVRARCILCTGTCIVQYCTGCTCTVRVRYTWKSVYLYCTKKTTSTVTVGRT